MGNAFFVTGTDTGVGKTHVAAGILYQAAARGLSTLAMKPVAAGCEPGTSGLENEDALVLQQAMTAELPYRQVNPATLEPAIAPHIAAQEAGLDLTVGGLEKQCRHILGMPAHLTLIEGAGGWRVPLNLQECLSDLVQALDIPVIVVIAMRLGCLNHGLLTVERILEDGLRVAGWVGNQVSPEPMPRLQENLETLRQRIPAPCLGTPGHDASGDPRLLARHLDIDPLLKTA